MIADDARVARVAYRITTAAGAICRQPGLQTGLVLHAADQYDHALRPAARDAFALGRHVAVAAVVPDSAAARAGLVADDAIVAIDGLESPSVVDAAPAGGTYRTVAAALARLDEALADGEATLAVVRPPTTAPLTVRLTPASGCRVRVQLRPSAQLNAFSDTRYATVTTALARFARTDDELAVTLGHEIAHSILGHEQRLAAARRRGGGPPAALVRETEREADHVGLYLAARAGYDLAAAIPYRRRLAAARGPALTLSRTHPSNRDRIAAFAATIAEIEAKRTDGRPLLPDDFERR